MKFSIPWSGMEIEILLGAIEMTQDGLPCVLPLSYVEFKVHVVHVD